MKPALRPIWLFFLLTVFVVPAVAQDDDLFGDKPANEAKQDDLFEAADGAKAPADKAGVDPAATGDGKADGNTELESAPADAVASTPLKPARKLHTQDEIKAELTRRNGQLATELTRFIELNKQVAKQAVESGNQDALMPILREYGPAVIRTKQLWIAVVGNPAKYDTWLGSADYWKAWVAFHRSWQSLYGYVDRFAAVDLDLADKLTDSLAALGTSFQDYSDWVDEWDRELGNDQYAFSRGNANLGERDQEQMREEEAADDETAEAAKDQQMEEEDEAAPSEVEEAQQATEEADRGELAEEEKEADAAADAAEGDDDLFGGAAKGEEMKPAADEAPTAEPAATKEEAADDGDDLFGDQPAAEEKPATTDDAEMPAADSEETPAPKEAEEDVFETTDDEKPASEEKPAGDEKPAEAEKPADDEMPADDEPAAEEKEEAPAKEAADTEEESGDDLFGDAAAEDKEAEEGEGDKPAAESEKAAEEDEAPKDKEEAPPKESEEEDADDLFGDG